MLIMSQRSEPKEQVGKGYEWQEASTNIRNHFIFGLQKDLVCAPHAGQNLLHSWHWPSIPDPFVSTSSMLELQMGTIIPGCMTNNYSWKISLMTINILLSHIMKYICPDIHLETQKGKYNFYFVVWVKWKWGYILKFLDGYSLKLLFE